MKTAFIYCRVSTDKQETERQLRELRKFCELNELTIRGEFQETMSGTKKRAERQKLVDAVAKHKPDYFVFHDYSRFSRNVKTALELKDELHELGVCLWPMQTNLKSLNEDGTVNHVANLIFTQLSAVYEMENETRRESIKSGLRNAVANGKTLGRPKGTTINKLEKYKSIVRDIGVQEKRRLMNEPYNSVRDTAKRFEKPKSLIIELRKLMREQGMLDQSKKAEREPIIS